MAHLRPMAALKNYRDQKGRKREASFEERSKFRMYDHFGIVGKVRNDSNFLATHVLDECVICPVCFKTWPTLYTFGQHFKTHDNWYTLNNAPVAALTVSWCDGGYTSAVELSEFSNHWVTPNNYEKISEGIEKETIKKPWKTQAAVTLQAVIENNLRRGVMSERANFEELLKMECGRDAYNNFLKHLKAEVKCFNKFVFGADANVTRSNKGRLYAVTGKDVPLKEGIYIGETGSYENAGLQRAFSHLNSGEPAKKRMLRNGMVVGQVCAEKEGEVVTKMERMIIEEEIRKYLKETLKLNTLNKEERHKTNCACPSCVG